MNATVKLSDAQQHALFKLVNGKADMTGKLPRVGGQRLGAHAHKSATWLALIRLGLVERDQGTLEATEAGLELAVELWG